MKIYKNKGKFEVLSKTEDIIFQIANAARTCYDSFKKQSVENDYKLVQNIINRGHHAMLEFADMTVKFTQCSRGVTHELVRHRVASYAQESTRYVNESDLHVIVPPHKDEFTNYIIRDYDNSNNNWSLYSHFENVQTMYKGLIKAGFKPEDARQVLPIATEAPICIKANLREWRHIFFMRCDKYAHWEIRKVMLDLLKWCKQNIPLIFDDFNFFVSDDNKNYATRVEPLNKIKDQLKHFMIANNVKDYQQNILKCINLMGVNNG